MKKSKLPNYRKADGEQRCWNCKHAKRLAFPGRKCERTKRVVWRTYDVKFCGGGWDMKFENVREGVAFSVVGIGKVCDLWEERHD